MTGFHIIAVLLTTTALFSYLNYRYLKLPTTIGVMLMALVVSLSLLGLNQVGIDFQWGTKMVAGIEFDQTLMQGLLSFLLFAGALHININDLAEQKITILILRALSRNPAWFSIPKLHLIQNFLHLLIVCETGRTLSHWTRRRTILNRSTR